jgi:hypothetical protein
MLSGIYTHSRILARNPWLLPPRRFSAILLRARRILKEDLL